MMLSPSTRSSRVRCITLLLPSELQKACLDIRFRCSCLRALAVHAKDDRAVTFYRHFGFIPSPTDARHLFMIIKDIRLAAGQKG